MTEVVLQPGDLLYIPRGWAHQAVATGGPQHSHSRNFRQQHSTENALEGTVPAKGHVDVPASDNEHMSLHVTFGMEAEPHTTWQAVVHAAVAAVVGRLDGFKHRDALHPSNIASNLNKGPADGTGDDPSHAARPGIMQAAQVRLWLCLSTSSWPQPLLHGTNRVRYPSCNTC